MKLAVGLQITAAKGEARRIFRGISMRFCCGDKGGDKDIERFCCGTKRGDKDIECASIVVLL